MSCILFQISWGVWISPYGFLIRLDYTKTNPYVYPIIDSSSQ